MLRDVLNLVKRARKGPFPTSSGQTALGKPHTHASLLPCNRRQNGTGGKSNHRPTAEVSDNGDKYVCKERETELVWEPSFAIAEIRHSRDSPSAPLNCRLRIRFNNRSSIPADQLGLRKPVWHAPHRGVPPAGHSQGPTVVQLSDSVR